MRTTWVGGDTVDWLSDGDISPKAEKEDLVSLCLDLEKVPNEELGSTQELQETALKLEKAIIGIRAVIEKLEKTAPEKRTEKDLEWFRRAVKSKALFSSMMERLKFVIRRRDHEIRQKRERKEKEARLAAKEQEIQKERAEKADVRVEVLRLINEKQIIPKDVLDALFQEAAKILKQKKKGKD